MKFNMLGRCQEMTSGVYKKVFPGSYPVVQPSNFILSTFTMQYKQLALASLALFGGAASQQVGTSQTEDRKSVV